MLPRNELSLVDDFSAESVLHLRCPACGADVQRSVSRFACTGCARIFAAQDGIPDFVITPGDREIVAFFERQAAAIAEQGESSISVGYITEGNQQLYAKSVYHLMGPRPRHLRILDLGCGHGALSSELTQDNQVVGVDFARHMLMHAKSRGLDVYLSDACTLPFADASFDLVLAAGLVQHVPDVAVLAAEVLRVLRPGGRVVMTGPNRLSLVRAGLALMRRVGLRPRYWKDSPPKLRSRRLYSSGIEAAGGVVRQAVGLTLPGQGMIDLPRRFSLWDFAASDLGFWFEHRA
jgi:SAM-dependent methyltransferase